MKNYEIVKLDINCARRKFLSSFPLFFVKTLAWKFLGAYLNGKAFYSFLYSTRILHSGFAMQCDEKAKVFFPYISNRHSSCALKRWVYRNNAAVWFCFPLATLLVDSFPAQPSYEFIDTNVSVIHSQNIVAFRHFDVTENLHFNVRGMSCCWNFTPRKIESQRTSTRIPFLLRLEIQVERRSTRSRSCLSSI